MEEGTATSSVPKSSVATAQDVDTECRNLEGSGEVDRDIAQTAEEIASKIDEFMRDEFTPISPLKPKDLEGTASEVVPMPRPLTSEFWESLDLARSAAKTDPAILELATGGGSTTTATAMSQAGPSQQEEEMEVTGESQDSTSRTDKVD